MGISELELRRSEKPKTRHIAALHEAKVNHKEFLFVKEDAESYTFYHIKTAKKFVLRR